MAQPPTRSLLTALHHLSSQPAGLSSKQQLLEERSAAAEPSLEFFVLLVIATVIATVGLIANSAAVVIGAMIVAPLMDPIISLAFGMATADHRLMLRASGLIALGVGITVATASLLSALLSIAFVDSQIMARTSPSLLDLIVAIAAGSVGAFAQSRSKIANSLAGVAVAVALVPPLCVTGIGLSQSTALTIRFNDVLVNNLSHTLASGSFLLFITNLIGIAFAATIVFLLQRYGSFRKSWLYAGTWLALLLILCAPLGTELRNFTARRDIESNFKQFKQRQISQLAIADQDHAFWATANICYVNTQLVDKILKVDLVVEGQANHNVRDILSRGYKNLKHEIEKEGNYTIDATISFIPKRTFTFDSHSLEST